MNSALQRGTNISKSEIIRLARNLEMRDYVTQSRDCGIPRLRGTYACGICMCMHAYMHACVRAYVRAYVCVCVCVLVHVCVCACACVCVHTYTYVFVLMFMCVCACVCSKPIGGTKRHELHALCCAC